MGSVRLIDKWPLEKLSVVEDQILMINRFWPDTILSGGWAWHYLTPSGHIEYRYAHDHKDVDLFVLPSQAGGFIAWLKEQGYKRTWTRFDSKSDTFFRYTHYVMGQKVMLDLFVANVPYCLVNGWQIVCPQYLLGLYGTVHGSNHCFSVQIARRLLNQGENPIGHPTMVDYSIFFKESS